MPYPLPPNEQERLRTLRAYKILDTKPEEQFDDLTKLVSCLCQVPMATITLIDENRQWFKSKVGWKLRKRRVTGLFVRTPSRKKTC